MSPECSITIPVKACPILFQRLEMVISLLLGSVPIKSTRTKSSDKAPLFLGNTPPVPANPVFFRF